MLRSILSIENIILYGYYKTQVTPFGRSEVLNFVELLIQFTLHISVYIFFAIVVELTLLSVILYLT